LFDYPGILELPQPKLKFTLLTDAYNYDLSPFRAQVVPNNQPFAFNLELVKTHEHAQHRLRVVTYNYGKKYETIIFQFALFPWFCLIDITYYACLHIVFVSYYPDYVLPGNGVFIERHDFIQCITPMSPDCGGFVLIGRERMERSADSKSLGQSGELELMAVTIPFGYTVCAYSRFGFAFLVCGILYCESQILPEFHLMIPSPHYCLGTVDGGCSVHSRRQHAHRNLHDGHDRKPCVFFTKSCLV
jgi:hypothetical protein